MMKNIKHKIRQYFLRDLMEMVDIEDVLSFKVEKDKDGKPLKKVYLSGEELDVQSISLLKESAGRMNDSYFWKILKRHLKWQAYLHAFNNNDLKGGQDIMLTLKLIQNFIDDIDKKM